MKETLIDSIPMKRVIKVPLLWIVFFQGWLIQLLTFEHCGFRRFFVSNNLYGILSRPIGQKILLPICPIKTVALLDKIYCT